MIGYLGSTLIGKRGAVFELYCFECSSAPGGSFQDIRRALRTRGQTRVLSRGNKAPLGIMFIGRTSSSLSRAGE